jgi:hypothetical protein
MSTTKGDVPMSRTVEESSRDEIVGTNIQWYYKYNKELYFYLL